MIKRELKSTKWGRSDAYSDYGDVEIFFDIWANSPDEDVDGSVCYEEDLKDCYFAPAFLMSQLLPLLNGKEKNILDVGCGTGIPGATLIARGHRLYGVDLSRNMLVKAQHKGFTDTFQGNILECNLPWDHKFDGLISTGILGEWVPPIPMLRRTLPLLKKEAFIAMTIEVDHSDIKDVMQFLEINGFELKLLESKLGLDHPIYEQEYYYYLIAQRH